MSTRAHAALLALLLTAGTACFEPKTIVGLSTEDRPVTTYPLPPFPALVKPGTVYAEFYPIYIGSQERTVSRYVLYDDGTFHFQLAVSPDQLFDFTGHWISVGSTVEFDWDARGSVGRVYATATLSGEKLEVSYNPVMWLTDYGTADYSRVPASP